MLINLLGRRQITQWDFQNKENYYQSSPTFLCFPARIGVWSVDFWVGRKTEEHSLFQAPGVQLVGAQREKQRGRKNTKAR